MKKTLLLIGCLIITSFLSAQVSTASLIAYYPFNGNANDASGNNNNGVVNGASLTTDRFGNPNSAYYFDGISNFINSSFPAISNKVTISFWFFTTAGYTNGPNFMETSSQFCSINQTNGSIDFAQNFSTGNYYVNSGTFNPLNNWHNVVMKSANDTISLYIDGVFKNFTIPTGTLTPISTLLLGKRPNNTGYYNGKLDDIRIYNRILYQNEISSLFQEGTTGITEINNNARIRVYPNPAADKITIETSQKVNVKILNSLGETVYSGDEKEISLTKYSSGIYFLRIFDEKDQTLSINKLIKN